MNVEDVLSGRYRLEQEIGSGGVGTVYQATDLRAGAAVAVKVLHPHLAKDPDFVRRFHRGARIARKLKDPNVVQVLDHGRDSERQYLVMELVEGMPLSSVLSSRGKCSEEEARSIVRQVALALKAAYRQRVVHRDIKPGNILITNDGVAKVTDFDIARAIDATSMTRTGLFVGSVRYAAPEAFSGRADIRSDIYSLGVVLYEMLTGHVPFESDNPLAVIEMHRSTEPPQLEQLDKVGEGTMAAVVQRCLEKRPEERFQDPQALVLALEGRAVARSRRRKTPPPGPRWSVPGWLRQPRGRYLLAGGGTILAVVLALAGGNVLFSGGEPPEGTSTPTRSPTSPPSTFVPTEVVRELTAEGFSAPGRTTRGLAWDGTNLWLSDDTELFKMDADGEVVDSYSAPEIAPEGLTWDGETFWVFTTMHSDIHQFSIDESADVPELRIINSFRSPNLFYGGTNDGLAWDGAGLWYSDADTVYRLDTAGNVLSSFSYDHDIAGLAWDGENLWLAYDSFDRREGATLVKTDTEGNTLLRPFDAPFSRIDALTWGDGYLWASGTVPYVGQPTPLGQQEQRMIYKIDLVTTASPSLTPMEGTPRPTAPRAGKIAFHSDRDDNPEIYVMNADGSGQTNLTDNPAWDLDPAWSPDGARIAFSSTRDGNFEVYVMNADGSGLTNLTDNPANDIAPSWSPDGARIAFYSYRDGNDEIYVMNADGSGQTNLTNNPAWDSAAAWSPDGDRIAFTSGRDGNDEVYVMNADGSDQTNLTNNPAWDFLPAWSPDGARIAFASNRDDNSEVYVMNADGSGQTNLTTNPAEDVDPAWSPDGTGIAFASTRDDNGEIYVMNADGSGQTRLTDDPAKDLRPAWSLAP